MVSRWIKTRYEIPFDMLPDTNLSAHNNKSVKVSIEFARQVQMGILSEISWRPRSINPISLVWSNKWQLMINCRHLNPHVGKHKIKLEYLNGVPSLVSQCNFISTDILETGY